MEDEMFREMRRKDKKIDLKEAESILTKEKVGILSTVDGEGQPYGIPVNHVYDDNKIYIHCALEGHKLDNIKDNPKVCFTVYGDYQIIQNKFTTNFESVVAFGNASLAEGSERDKAFKMIIEKFSPDFKEEGHKYTERLKDKTAVIKIVVSHISGKAQRNR